MNVWIAFSILSDMFWFLLTGIEESSSPMLPQRILAAKKSVTFSDQSEPSYVGGEYHEIDEVSLPATSPASSATSRSLPDIPEMDDTTPIYSTPHRNSRRHSRTKSLVVLKVSSPL